MSAILELKHISKHYPDGDELLSILDNLDLSVSAGEFVAILGPSGSGKSTLLSIAGLLLGADQGSLYVNHENVTDLSQRQRTQLRREALGFIFQSHQLLPYLTIQEQLQQEGYQFITASNGQEALNCLDTEEVQLIITDIMMPMMDGYQLIQELRSAAYNVPIIVMTAKSQMEDMTKGFGLGADDYMVKPVQLQELALRIKALLRRANIVAQHQLIIGNTCLNEDELSLKYFEQEIVFPQKEFRVLFHLLSYPNRIFTRLELLDSIWGMDTDLDERVVDACINKIRRKVEHLPDFKIETVRGVGYRAKND
ncbi:DNA-binding response regulator [Streptococcus agalactiae]|uniref:response regulator n=4 Tax=Bacilli TaxID=91061 RepID=UPI0005E47DB4|nr:response regulator [Streptococcus agalactiae]CNJ57338.1 DNA-binding response regulator [Streptococcus agalactiae]